MLNAPLDRVPAAGVMDLSIALKNGGKIHSTTAVHRGCLSYSFFVKNPDGTMMLTSLVSIAWAAHELGGCQSRISPDATDALKSAIDEAGWRLTEFASLSREANESLLKGGLSPDRVVSLNVRMNALRSELYSLGVPVPAFNNIPLEIETRLMSTAALFEAMSFPVELVA